MPNVTVADFSVAVVLQPAAAGRNTIQPTADDVPGVAIKAHSATQSANLQEWQDSSGSPIFAVTPDFRLNLRGPGFQMYYDSPSGSANFNASSSTLNFMGNTIDMRAPLRLSPDFGAQLQFNGSGVAAPSLFQSLNDRYLTVQVQEPTGGVQIQGAAGQTAALLKLRQLSATATVRDAALVDAVFAVSSDATRQGRLTLAAAGFNGSASEGLRIEGDGTGGGTRVGAFGAAAVAKPGVSGSRGANAALASLLTALASLGWVTDGSSA